MTHPLAGRKQTPEHIEKRAAKHRGLKYSADARRRMSLGHRATLERLRANPNYRHWNTGRVRSEETRRKISEVQRGRKLTAEHKQHVREAALARGFGKWMKGRKLPINTRRKMSQSARGSLAPNWKGGISRANLIIRGSLDYRLWREAVFQRDNWTCQKCGNRGGDLEAHHIKPFAYFPDLRFEVSNGQTLCRKCHQETPSYKRNQQI